MISLLIAKKEFVRSLKSKRKLVFMLIVPLITIIAAIGVNTLMKPTINFGVLGENRAAIEFQNKMNNIEGVNVSEANKDSVNTDMILGNYLAVVDFTEFNNIKVYSLDKKVTDLVEEGINNTVLIENLLASLQNEDLNIAQRSSGFIFMMLMISCVIVSCTMLKDKEDGVLVRYTLSGNSIGNYIFGNFIYNFLVTSIQVVASILVLSLVGINFGIAVGNFILITIIIALITSSSTTLITLICKSELQGNILASAMALITSLLGGAFIPIDKMPDLLKVISNISVTKWIIELAGDMNFTILIGIILFAIMLIITSLRIGRKKLI